MDKILECIWKLICLKELIILEGEVKVVVIYVKWFLKEYNFFLFDVNEKWLEMVFEIREFGVISYKDSFGNYWKCDLLCVLCEYNYCWMFCYWGIIDMLIVGM